MWICMMYVHLFVCLFEYVCVEQNEAKMKSDRHVCVSWIGSPIRNPIDSDVHLIWKTIRWICSTRFAQLLCIFAIEWAKKTTRKRVKSIESRNRIQFNVQWFFFWFLIKNWFVVTVVFFVPFGFDIYCFCFVCEGAIHFLSLPLSLCITVCTFNCAFLEEIFYFMKSFFFLFIYRRIRHYRCAHTWYELLAHKLI